MEEAAEALDLMNIEHQLQHLDIKPQNLFLVHNHIKVADFGLVKDLEGMQRHHHRWRDAALRRAGDLRGLGQPLFAISTAWPSSTRSCSPVSGRSTAPTPASS